MEKTFFLFLSSGVFSPQDVKSIANAVSSHGGVWVLLLHFSEFCTLLRLTQCIFCTTSQREQTTLALHDSLPAIMASTSLILPRKAWKDFGQWCVVEVVGARNWWISNIF